MRDYEAEYRFMLIDPKHSEIIEHLNILRRYASVCDSVVEIGTHDGSTAFAMMMGRPNRLHCIDIRRHPDIEMLEDAAHDLHVSFEFIESDSLRVSPRETDLLFVDSYHTGSQLIQELAVHGAYVRRYILMHDTEIFGDVGEDGGPGLWGAIRSFLMSTTVWRLDWHRENNNGLTCLVRI